MSLVVDNSVALAWCFESEQTPALMALLDHVGASGALAPQLWPLEAINGLAMAERRGRIDRVKHEELRDFLRALPIKLDDETNERAWTVTARLAAHHRLSVYDATYLELSLRRRLPLATLDRPLRDVAGSLGVELLGR